MLSNVCTTNDKLLTSGHHTIPAAPSNQSVHASHDHQHMTMTEHSEKEVDRRRRRKRILLASRGTHQDPRHLYREGLETVGVSVEITTLTKHRSVARDSIRTETGVQFV